MPTQADDPSISLGTSAHAQEITPIRLRPSTSVLTALQSFAPEERISAGAVIRAILAVSNHRQEYADGKLASLRILDTAATYTSMEWLEQVQTLFDAARLKRNVKSKDQPMLTGRMAIAGLCIREPWLREVLSINGGFDTLLNEIDPPLEKILSRTGKEIYSRIRSSGRSLPDSFVSVFNWDDDPLKAPQDDYLGRAAFARFLAKRITNIPSSCEAYTLHIHAPWGAGKSTLLNFLKLELTQQHLHLFDIEDGVDGIDLQAILQALKEKRLIQSLVELFEKKGEALKSVISVTARQNEWVIEDIDEGYLLKAGKEKLEVYTQRQRWLVVEFNAWRNQHVTPPWWSLMDAVFTKTKRSLRLQDFIREHWWRLTTGRMPYILSAIIVVWVFDLMIAPLLPSRTADTSMLSFLASNLKDVSTIVALATTIWGIVIAFNRSLLVGAARAAQSYSEVTYDPMETIKRHFDELIHRLRPKRVAIFIDDLDRCQSTYVVNLLEGIQTLFREAPVIFVIAADRAWLNACYEQVYDELKPLIREPGKQLGMMFLEKAFRFSTPLPRISDALLKEYWKYLLLRQPSETTDEARSVARDLVATAQDYKKLPQLIRSSQDQGFVQRALREEAAVHLATPKVMQQIENTLEPYAELLELNPRSMKRLVNTYSANLALSFLSDISIDPHQLILWTILSSRWPLLAEALVKEPKVVEYLAKGERDQLSDDLKKTLGEEIDEIEKVVKGLKPTALTTETIEHCKFMHV